MTLKAFAWGALFFLMPLAVSAQETPSPAPAMVIANINISEAKILSQTPDGILRVISTITNNGTETQSDIRLGLDIVKKTDAGQAIVDSFVSDQALSLAPGESLQQEIRYPAQSFLSGEYEVWVIGKTTGGLMLGLSMAGNLTFASTSASVEIVPESCVLQVAGDEKSYSLSQGVDVTSEETLAFSCAVENHADTPREITPSFDTYRHSMYGERVAGVDSAAQVISLAANERKQVSFVIPKAAQPQIYAVRLVLTDTVSQALVSNKVIAHYVLRGGSATIQNASLDKSTYEKGDSLLARLLWTPAADQFQGSRAGRGVAVAAVAVTMNILDEDGHACIEPVSKKITPEDVGVVTLPATTLVACVAPQATFMLSDAEGKILDSRTFSNSSAQEPEAPDSLSVASVSSTFFGGMQFLILSVMVVLFLISLLLIGWKFVASKRKLPSSHTLKSFIFLILLSAGVFTGAGTTKALTFTGAFPPFDGSGFDNFFGFYAWGETYTVNINKNTFAPSETITLSGSIYIYANATFGATPMMTMALNGISTSMSGQFGVTAYGTRYLTAPSAPGNYSIAVTGCNEFGCVGGTIPIIVAAASVNGTCNASAPNSCATGSLGTNAIQPNGSYHWYCNGLNGGLTSNLCTYTPPAQPQTNAPVNGTCQNSTPNVCATGTLGANALQPNGDYHWYCNGLNGGSTSPLCWYVPSVTAQPPVAPPTAPPAPTYYNGQNVDIIAVPNPVPYNTAALLKWKTVYMTDCTASGAWSGTKTVHGGYSYYPGESTGNLTSAKTYTLSCTGSNGAVSGTSSVTVNVLPPAAAPVPAPSCVVNCSAAAGHCSGELFNDANNCGTNNCTGTRFCDFNWREVAP